MRYFPIMAFYLATLLSLSACGKRPSVLETPTNTQVAAPTGYPAAEPAPTH